jgi:hypothetical protein
VDWRKRLGWRARGTVTRSSSNDHHRPARRSRRNGAVVCYIAALAAFEAHCCASPVLAAGLDAVDTGLVLAVDVSGSVDADRYRLQMAGIAAAFEDPAVQDAILSGPRQSLLITLVQWSDKAQISVPWTLIASAGDALAFANKVRVAPRVASQFTCMSQMMRFVADKVFSRMPVRSDRAVLDVSGDGRDNCNPRVPVDALRDELVAENVTINGLPILEGDESATLSQWYRSYVIGGSGAFLLAATGFQDFARAMRQKFITEISSASR